MTNISEAAPAVSVMLPARNAAQHLAEALDSVLAQTFGDFELVAADHASADGTGDILQQYAEKDARVRPFRFGGENFIECLNHLRAQCRGRYLARMDADDIMHPERLGKQKAFLDDNRAVDILGTGVAIFGDNVREGYQRYQRWINGVNDPQDIRRQMFVESPIPNPTLMVRAEAFDRLGGYEEHGWPEDYDFYFRAYFAGMTMQKLPEVLLRWRDHDHRSTRTLGRYSKKSFLRVRAFYLAKLLNGGPAVLQGGGTTGKLLGRYLKEYGANLKAVLDINPRRIGKSKMGLPVHGMEDMAAFREKGFVLLAAVSSWGARDEIRAAALDAGYKEGVDFFACS